jgi:hypothetical protein
MRPEVQINLSDFVAAARQAGEQENWLAALALALTLPDVCASADRPGKQIAKSRYIEWWDKYIAPMYMVAPDLAEDWHAHSYLPGTDAFYLRCSYLHSGMDGVEDRGSLMHRVRLRAPSGSWGMGFEAETRTLTVPIDMFVERVCLGVEGWLEDRAEDPVTQERLAGLISVLPSAVILVEGDKARRWPKSVTEAG